MLEKEWLKRVTIAYKSYSEQFGENESIENFITWLYKQYGIVEEKGD